MPTNEDWTFFRPFLALRDRAVETLEDLAGQEVLQSSPIAVRVGHDDHFVGHFCAVEERARFECLVGVADRAQALVDIAAWRGNLVDRRINLVGVGFPAPSRQRDDIVVGERIARIAARLVAIEVTRRPLVAGAAAEYVAQLEEDNHRCDQEKQRA